MSRGDASLGVTSIKLAYGGGRGEGGSTDWNLGPRALVLPLDGYETSGESLNLSAVSSSVKGVY